ncbi:unnamed protein product [Fraxinus pennsylvanica]|uniref:Uncharacterized protein n=1 Tax=Fraxinus pennsylvanica TaxID=56036 RepID=A0AAD1YXE6_9LAMI|nr:unnamed protein product [Fraxinus pennsylvanica]
MTSLNFLTDLMIFEQPVNTDRTVSSNQLMRMLGAAMATHQVPLHCVYHLADCSIANNTSFASSSANSEVPSTNINFGFSSIGSSSESNAVGPGNGPTASGALSSSFAATATSLFGSSWQSPKSSNLGSTFTSPSPSTRFAFGATSSSFAATSTALMPVFGNPPTFAASTGNDQMNADDRSTVQSQPSPFQFAGQQNQVASQNPSSFQALASLEFNAGGSFSLGSGGDKSGRKYVKASRSKNRKK